MKTFVIAGQSYQAENCIDDILINPVLPEGFDNTPTDATTFPATPPSQILSGGY